MPLIKTKNFELAIYSKGDPSSSKLAIVIPGRLDSKDYIHCTSLVDFLATQGYFALSYDPPGSWESGGGIEIYSTTNYIKAIDELIEYFGNKPTLLAGHSRGGTVAMLAGPKNPHVIHFISIFSFYGAPSDPKEEKIKDGRVVSYRDMPPGTSPTKEQKKFELPLSYFEEGKQYNALPALAGCTKPKLFFYGIHDKLIDADEIKEAYEKSADPKEIHALDSDHDYRYHPEIVEEVNKVVREFLDKFPLQ